MQYNLSLLGDGLRRCKGEKENSSWFEIRNENEEVFCFIISRQYLICNGKQILSDIRYTDFSFWLKSQATISVLFLFLTLILLQIPLRFWQSYLLCSYYFICHPKYYNGRNSFWIPNFIISSLELKCNVFLILVKQYCSVIHDNKKYIFHIIIYILRVRYMLLLSWLFLLHPSWQYEKLYSSYFYNKEQDVRGNITQKSCGLASSKRPSIATVISRTHLVCLVWTNTHSWF